MLQYVAAVTASMATFSTGIVLGWPAQITRGLLDGVLGFPIDIDELGWICSIFSVGAAVLTLVVGPWCDVMGRKVTMLLLIIVFEVGWLLIVFANSAWLLIVGRFLTGMCAGAYCVTVSIYIDEIAQKEMRGTLGSLTQFMISSGILFANLTGAFLPIRYYFLVCAAMPIVFGLAFFTMPESPVYLLLRGRTDASKAALKRLTGKDDVGAEFEEIKKSTESDTGQLLSLRELLGKRSVRRAFVIGIGLAALKPLSGIDAVTAYMSHIFHQTDTPLSPEVATIIFSTVQILALIPQSYSVDRTGRKILLLVSQFLMALCLSATSICILVVHDSTALTYIPLVAMCLYTIGFAVGIGPIGWIMMAEIFEDKIRGRAISFCTFLIWSLAFVSVKMFLVLEDLVDISLPLFFYSVVSFAGGIFVLFVVRETKNKSAQEIEEMLSM